jgi:hypothetical protein
MPLLSKPSSAARTALVYITLGSLIIVWTGISYLYLFRYPPEREYIWYWCHGFMLTGIVLLVIGLALGRIGRAARHAELPPQEVTPAEANIDKNMAARAPVVAPVSPAMPGMPYAAPGVQVPAPPVTVAPPTAPRNSSTVPQRTA